MLENMKNTSKSIIQNKNTIYTIFQAYGFKFSQIYINLFIKYVSHIYDKSSTAVNLLYQYQHINILLL